MKHYLLTSAALLFFCLAYTQQNVGIGTTTPHSSSLLHLNSTTKGFLLPSMTTSQRLSIPSPANGLMVFDTDKNELYHYAGTAWKVLVNGNYWSRPITSRDRIANTTDSVGIGISGPTERLDVNGNIRSRNRIDADGVIEGAGLSTSGSLYAAGTSLLQGNITSYGSATVTGNITSNTGMIINDAAGTLQFKSSGDDKGFVQLSGNDLRIGTNSANTTGKFVVRTNGYDQMVLDGTLGINVLKLYAAGTHRASLTTSTNDNLAINTVNANSQLQLNNEVYIDIDNSRTGFGTANPEERVHISSGNLKITGGKLYRAAAGPHDMMPLCYGRINANGTIFSATSNVSVNRTSAGNYEITCSGITDASVILVTVYGSTRYIGTGSYVSAGKMLVSIENIKEVIDDPDAFHSNDDKTFYFVIYN